MKSPMCPDAGPARATRLRGARPVCTGPASAQASVLVPYTEYRTGLCGYSSAKLDCCGHSLWP